MESKSGGCDMCKREFEEDGDVISDTKTQSDFFGNKYIVDIKIDIHGNAHPIKSKLCSSCFNNIATATVKKGRAKCQSQSQ